MSSNNDTKETSQMSEETTTAATGGNTLRYFVFLVLVLGAFLGAYRYAAARTGGSVSEPPPVSATPASGLSGNQTGSACACCGSSAPTENGLTGEKVEGRATVDGAVQKISVDVSKGYYEPNQIVLKAGVPAEITFGQGSGCTAQVISNELGFGEDISASPKTVRLPALEKGEYPFYCGMQMVFGKIVVE